MTLIKTSWFIKCKGLLNSPLTRLQKWGFRVSIFLTVTPCILIVCNTVLGIVSLYSSTSDKGVDLPFATILLFIIRQTLQLAAVVPVAIIVPLVLLFAFKWRNNQRYLAH